MKLDELGFKKIKIVFILWKFYHIPQHIYIHPYKPSKIPILPSFYHMTPTPHKIKKLKLRYLPNG